MLAENFAQPHKEWNRKYVRTEFFRMQRKLLTGIEYYGPYDIFKVNTLVRP